MKENKKKQRFKKNNNRLVCKVQSFECVELDVFPEYASLAVVDFKIWKTGVIIG